MLRLNFLTKSLDPGIRSFPPTSVGPTISLTSALATVIRSVSLMRDSKFGQCLCRYPSSRVPCFIAGATSVRMAFSNSVS